MKTYIIYSLVRLLSLLVKDLENGVHIKHAGYDLYIKLEKNK